MKGVHKKLISLLISLSLLTIIYLQVDLKRTSEILMGLDGRWLGASIVTMLVLLLGISFRFTLVVPRQNGIGVGKALKLTLIAMAFNKVLPAKLGDLSKSLYLYKNKGIPKDQAVAVVVLDRLCDVIGLTGLSMMTWLLIGFRDDNVPTSLMVATALLLGISVTVVFWNFSIDKFPLPLPKLAKKLMGRWQFCLLQLKGERKFGAVLFSLVLWTVHLWQFQMFFYACGVEPPLVISMGLTTLVLLCGLFPFTFSGIGPRDLALIVLFAPFFDSETAVAIGLLAIGVRLLLPLVLAVPFLPAYFGMISGSLGELRKSVTRRGGKGLFANFRDYLKSAAS